MSRIPPIKNLKKVSLWSGNKTMSGALNLSDAANNYDFLLVVTQSNVDIYTDIVMLGYSSSYVFSHSSGSGNGDGFPQYRSLISLAFNSTFTQATIGGVLYNNVNWQLGIREIWGIKIT